MYRHFVMLVATMAAGVSATACGDDAASDGSAYSGEESSADSGGGGGDQGGAHGSDAASNGWTESDAGGWSADATEDASVGEDAGGNTNVSFGGELDFGFYRSQIAAGIVPRPDEFDAPGFFAEHHTPLPTPDCGERVCLQAMMAVMTSLSMDLPCTMLQVGLNSPIVADEANRPPLNLTVVVDVSGSMAEDAKIAFVRDGLGRLIDEMDDDDRLALVSYSTAADVVVEMTELDGNRSLFRDEVAALQANGATNIEDALRVGFAAAAANFDSGRQNRVILLSDGQPSTGIESTTALLQLAASLTELEIGLTTIGVGTDYNRTLMLQLAQQGDGNAYFVENAAAVSEVFSDELSYFTVPVAYDLQLRVNEGTFYDLGDARGAIDWQPDAEGGSLAIPSVFLAHRVSHDDVTEGGGRRGGGSALLLELMSTTDSLDDALAVEPVAEITLRYREPGTNRIVEQSEVVHYPYSPAKIMSTGYFAGRNIATVQKSFVMLNIFVALQVATGAYHDGDSTTAINTLELVLSAVEDYNEELADVDIAYDLEIVRDTLALIRELTVEEVPPADERDDPWPCD